MSSPYRPHLPPVPISLIPPSDHSRNSILSPTTRKQRSSRQNTERFSHSRSGSFPPVSARLIANPLSSRTLALLSENTSSTIITSITNSSKSSSSSTTNLDGEKIRKNKSTQSLTHTPLKSPEVVREPWVTTTSSSFAVYSKSDSPQLTSDRFASKGGFRQSQSSDKLSLLNKNEILIRETQALTDSLQKELALASSLYKPSPPPPPPPLAAAAYHHCYLSSSRKLEACTRAISGITSSAAAKDQLSASLINLLSIIADTVQSSIPPLSIIDGTSPNHHAVIDISEAKIDDVCLHRSTSWLTTGSDSTSANATKDKQASNTVEAVDAIIRPHRRHASSSDNSYDGFRSFLSSTDSFSIDDVRTSQTARQPRYGRRSGDDTSHSQSWKSRDSSGSMASFDSGIDDVGRAVAKSTTILGRAGLQISSSTSTSQNASLGSPTPSSFLSVGGNGNTCSTHQQRSKIGSSSQLRRNSMPACVPGVPRLVFTDSANVSSGFIEAASHLPHPPPSSSSSSSNTTNHENSSPEAMDPPPRRPKLSFQDEFVSMVWNNPDGEMSLTWRELLAELPNTY